MKGKRPPEGWYESECCWNCEAEDLEKMHLRCRPVVKRKPGKFFAVSKLGLPKLPNLCYHSPEPFPGSGL